MKREIEVMAPAGSRAALSAALRAGADSVYFGVGEFNMRARAAANFARADLRRVVRCCHACGASAYLTLNVVMYDDELEEMRELCREALRAGVDAVIASDISVIEYAHSIGLPVHVSVQANVCNCAAVRFFAQYADVMVLARELRLPQIRRIVETVRREGITGPSGGLVRMEVFAHGALCVAISGKCFMSLAAYNSSANRGACYQVCRRAYRVSDAETGFELEIDNQYVMSPRDICTIRVVDQLLDAGISVLKIEGRGRSEDYVSTVTAVYREAVDAWRRGIFSEEAALEWENRLRRVYNRGFWQGGYYLGEPWEAWSGGSDSRAFERRLHAARVTRYYARQNVAELCLEASGLACGQTILICGPSTGALRTEIAELRQDVDGQTLSVFSAPKGSTVCVAVPRRVRRNDRVYLAQPRRLDRENRSADGEEGA